MANTAIQSAIRLRNRTTEGAGFPRIFSLLASCSLLLAGAAKATSFQPRVHIPDVVQVEGETVRLSDLLPPDAPAELGEMATRIILGNSPLPASQRVISKGQIEQQLRELPSILERLDLPERLLVTCKRRRLSAAEILAAIEVFRAGEGLHGSEAQTCFPRSAARSPRSEPKAADLGKQVCAIAGRSLQAPVLVTKPDPGLEVRRVEFDRVQRKTRFLLWTSKEPQILPFYVTVKEWPETGTCASSHNERTGEDPIPTDCQVERRKAGEDLTDSPALLSGGSSGVIGHKGGSTPQATSSSPVLVAAGKPAKLVVETATLRMTVLVTPLQSGVKGQLIRVRNLDTQRVFEAEVVGADLLQAELGRK